MASLKYGKTASLQTVTLGSSYTSGSGSMSLTSGHGARLPSSGDFWLTYDDGAGTVRIYKVTARSTDTLTVTAESSEGSGDGNISSGSTLRWALTCGALDQLKRDAGSLVFIEQQTASSSSALSFTSCFTSSYNNYLIVLEDLLPATNAVNLILEVSTDGGSSYLSSGYSGGYWVWSSGGGGAGSVGSASMSLAISQSNSSTNKRCCGEITFRNPLGTSSYKDINARVSGWDGSSHYTYLANGTNTTTSAVNAFRLKFSSGNISSGNVYVYGLLS